MSELDSAQKICEKVINEYSSVIGDRYFRVEFKTNMVPLVYIKFVGAPNDSLTSQLVAAKRSMQFIIYGFNEDGSLRDDKISATSPDQKINNITNSPKVVVKEIINILNKYI